MKRLLLLLALCAISYAAFGQQPAATPASPEDVQRFLDAMHSREMMQQMVDAMSGPMHRTVHAEFLQFKAKYKDLPDSYEAQMQKEMDTMFRTLPWDDLLKTVTPVYQKHFTKQDLQALTA